MYDTSFSNINLSSDSEVQQHMPRSLQIMISIEEQAQAAVNEMLRDIEAGKTTLEAVKRSRGLKS